MTARVCYLTLQELYEVVVKYKNVFTVMGIMVALSSGCVTSGERDQINNNIFDIKTRLLTIENRLKGGSQVSDFQSKSLASSKTQLEKLAYDIRRIQGDMEAIKIGVTTGEMPGQQNEVSIAKILKDLEGRIAAMETKLTELAKAKPKAKAKQKSKKLAKSTQSAQPTQLKSLQAAFAKGRYKSVARDAAGFIKSAAGKSRQEAMYLHAESLYKLGSLREAALKYNDLIEAQPEAARLAYAKMRMGDCFRHLGDKDTAKLYYEDLLSSHPKTVEARKAKEQLKKL